MPPDPLELFLFFNQLQLCLAERKCGNYGPPLLKFLATPLKITEIVFKLNGIEISTVIEGDCEQLRETTN